MWMAPKKHNKNGENLGNGEVLAKFRIILREEKTNQFFVLSPRYYVLSARVSTRILCRFCGILKDKKSRRAKVKCTSVLAGYIPPKGLIFWWTPNGGCEELQMYFEKQNTF